MPNYRCQAIIKTADGVSANYATNTLYCTATDSPAALGFATEVVSRFVAFSAFMSPLALGTLGVEARSYNMADPEPRQPLQSVFGNLTGLTGAPMPTEVAICMSYRADVASGEIAARRRGRIYLPFLNEGNNDTTARPDSPLMTAVKAFGEGLYNASNAAPDWTWVQHSVVDGTYTPVAYGFVDNEWDTQRRRGRRRTLRVTWP